MEIHEYIQLPAPKTLPGFEKWKGLRAIGVAIMVQGKSERWTKRRDASIWRTDRR